MSLGGDGSGTGFRAVPNTPNPLKKRLCWATRFTTRNEVHGYRLNRPEFRAPSGGSNRDATRPAGQNRVHARPADRASCNRIPFVRDDWRERHLWWEHQIYGTGSAVPAVDSPVQGQAQRRHPRGLLRVHALWARPENRSTYSRPDRPNGPWNGD